MSAGLLTVEERATIRQAVAEALRNSLPELAPGLERDRAAFVRLVGGIATASAACEDLLAEAVASGRAAGLSWEAVGSAMGMTRQGAQQRFGGAANLPAEGSGQRVVRGVHAFNEQAVLGEQGREGWHLVAFGGLYMVFEPSSWRWQHRRLILATSAARSRMERAGWQEVGTWFPFTYYKRREE